MSGDDVCFCVVSVILVRVFVFSVMQLELLMMLEISVIISVSSTRQWHHNPINPGGDNSLSLNVECDIRGRQRRVGRDKTPYFWKG